MIASYLAAPRFIIQKNVFKLKIIHRNCARLNMYAFPSSCPTLYTVSWLISYLISLFILFILPIVSISICFSLGYECVFSVPVLFCVLLHLSACLSVCLSLRCTCPFVLTFDLISCMDTGFTDYCRGVGFTSTSRTPQNFNGETQQLTGDAKSTPPLSKADNPIHHKPHSQTPLSPTSPPPEWIFFSPPRIRSKRVGQKHKPAIYSDFLFFKWHLLSKARDTVASSLIIK